MATVINNPGNRDDNGGGAGWAVAVIVLLVVIGVGAYLWMRYQGTTVVTPPATTGSNTINNITLPGTSATTSVTATSSSY